VSGENDGYRGQSPTNDKKCKGGWKTTIILLGTEKWWVNCNPLSTLEKSEMNGKTQVSWIL